MSQLTMKALEAEKATEDVAVTVPILDLGGEPYTNHAGEPVRMSLFGEHSDVVRKAEAETQRRIRKLRLSRVETIPQEFWDEALARKCTAALAAWGMEAEDGTPLPITLAAVREVIKVAPWIRDQILGGLGDHASFLLAGSPNS